MTKINKQEMYGIHKWTLSIEILSCQKNVESFKIIKGEGNMGDIVWNMCTSKTAATKYLIEEV